MPPSAGGKNASLQDLKERHLLTPRRKKMMEEAAIHPERCPGCDERFEVPPSNLHSNEDATWCHIPKLLPCLHTVSAAFLQSQVEEHEEVNRLLLQEGCSSHDERWAELDRELKALQDDHMNSRKDLIGVFNVLPWFEINERKRNWLLGVYESWPEDQRVSWLRNLLPPDRKSEVRCPVCNQFWGVHQGGVDGLPNNYLVIQNLRRSCGDQAFDGESSGHHNLAYLKGRLEERSGEESLKPSLSSQSLSLEQEEMKMQIMQLQHENAVLKSNMERTLLLHAADRVTQGTVVSRIQQLIDDTSPLIEEHEAAIDDLRRSISVAQDHRGRVVGEVKGHFADLRSRLDEKEQYYLDEVNNVVDSHLAPFQRDLEARLRGVNDGQSAVRLTKRCLEEEFDESHLVEMEQPMVEKLEQVQRALRDCPTEIGYGQADLYIEFEPGAERTARIERELHKLGAIITEPPDPPRRNDRRRLRLSKAPQTTSGLSDITFTVNAGIPNIGENNRRFHEDYEQYFIYVRGQRRGAENPEAKPEDDSNDDEKGEILGCVEVITRTIGPKDERWDHSTKQGFQTYGEENKGEVPVLRFTQDTVFEPRRDKRGPGYHGGF